MVLQEGLVRAEVLQLRWREARGGGGVEEVMEGVGVDLVEERGALSVHAAIEGKETRVWMTVPLLAWPSGTNAPGI